MGEHKGESASMEIDPNDAAIAWAQELERRVSEVESGTVECIPGPVASARLYAILDDKG
jgi:hypothetical protein